MEAPDTWSFQFATGELGKDVASNLLTIDALLYGRRTYEEMAAAWPSRTGVMADQFNGIAKYAVSTTLSEVTWNNSTLIKDNVAEEVSQLKQRPGQDILILGSADLVHFLKLHDLIDEYWLSRRGQDAASTGQLKGVQDWYRPSHLPTNKGVMRRRVLKTSSFDTNTGLFFPRKEPDVKRSRFHRIWCHICLRNFFTS